MFVSGDKLAVTLMWHGTHTGPYGGVPATGKPVAVRDTAIAMGNEISTNLQTYIHHLPHP